MNDEHDDDDDDARDWIIIRWHIADDTVPDDEVEAFAEELGERLDVVLGDTGAGELLGFEVGPGALEIHIEGSAAENPLEPHAEALAQLCLDFGSPEGSHLEWLSADRTRGVAYDIGRPGVRMVGRAPLNAPGTPDLPDEE